VARTRLGPDGEVEVDGARWSATAHRAAGITAGDPVTVAAVQGTVLEVEPKGADRPVK
jgi:membrane protein implicated in regulation of membrane protease activity